MESPLCIGGGTTMENTKIVHPLYFHEDGTSALKAEVQDTSCKLVGLPGNIKYEKTRMTEEELQREYDYYMAEKIAKRMHDSGIISIKEYTKLREENRRFFSPFLAEIS